VACFTSFVLELMVNPAMYEVWKWHFEVQPALAVAGSRLAETLG
jgi:hypothetical protein